MAMDPYGAYDSQPMDEQQGSGFSPLGAVGEYYKFKYTAMPSTWSPGKGIATPFGITGTSAKSWLDKAVTAGTVDDDFSIGRFMGNAWKNRGDLFGGEGTGRVFGSAGDKKLINKIIDYRQRAQAHLSTLRTRIGDIPRDMVRPKYGSDFVRFKGKTGKGWIPRAYKRTSFRVGNKIVEEKALEETAKNWEKANVLGKRARTTKARIGQLSKKLSGVKRTAFMKQAAIGTAKAASFIGAAMMIADIGMMIGQPIGRAIVEQTNAAMERAENRFMPELGGKLNAAYLSYGAATERQRALQAISKSHINGRSAFGTEAALMHS